MQSGVMLRVGNGSGSFIPWHESHKSIVDWLVASHPGQSYIFGSIFILLRIMRRQRRIAESDIRSPARVSVGFYHVGGARAVTTSLVSAFEGWWALDSVWGLF